MFPYLPARYFWQFKIFSFYTLSNVKQTEFVFLNGPFIQDDCVPTFTFSVASGSVNLFPAFLSLYWPRSFTEQLQQMKLFYVWYSAEA